LNLPRPRFDFVDLAPRASTPNRGHCDSIGAWVTVPGSCRKTFEALQGALPANLTAFAPNSLTTGRLIARLKLQIEKLNRGRLALARSVPPQELPAFKGQERVTARTEAARRDGTAASRRRLLHDRAVADHESVKTTQT
jgi:hypothetical protein